LATLSATGRATNGRIVRVVTVMEAVHGRAEAVASRWRRRDLLAGAAGDDPRLGN
jgi:hypothetical protein